jgi:hypothetical protein
MSTDHKVGLLPQLNSAHALAHILILLCDLPYVDSRFAGDPSANTYAVPQLCHVPGTCIQLVHVPVVKEAAPRAETRTHSTAHAQSSKWRP